MTSPAKFDDNNKGTDTSPRRKKNAFSATPWLDKGATEKDVLMLIDDLDRLMSVSPHCKSTLSSDGKVLYGGDWTEQGELKWNHNQPFFFWKDDERRKEEAKKKKKKKKKRKKKPVTGEQIFEWCGDSQKRIDVHNNVQAICCKVVDFCTEWQSVTVGERNFTGLGVNYGFFRNELKAAPQCVALITLSKEGSTIHEDFFKDGPVRVSIKVVNGPQETYKEFRNRLLMTAQHLRFEGGRAGETDAGSRKTPEIQTVDDFQEESNLCVRNAKVDRIESWTCLAFNDRMLGAITRVTDAQKPSPLASFLAPLILDGYDVKAIVSPGASPDDYLIPLIWKLSQDLADEGGLADVKNGLAAPRLVVLSGDVAACQRIYGLACSLASGSKLKVCKSHFVEDNDQFSREMEDLAQGCHVLCTTFQRAHLLFDLLKVATAEDVRCLVLDDMHKAVEQESLEIVPDLFKQSEFPSTEKRQTVLLSGAREPALETAARALLKPDCAEIYEDACSSLDEPGSSRQSP